MRQALSLVLAGLLGGALAQAQCVSTTTVRPTTTTTSTAPCQPTVQTVLACTSAACFDYFDEHMPTCPVCAGSRMLCQVFVCNDSTCAIDVDWGSLVIEKRHHGSLVATTGELLNTDWIFNHDPSGYVVKPFGGMLALDNQAGLGNPDVFQTKPFDAGHTFDMEARSVIRVQGIRQTVVATAAVPVVACP